MVYVSLPRGKKKSEHWTDRREPRRIAVTHCRKVKPTREDGTETSVKGKATGERPYTSTETQQSNNRGQPLKEIKIRCAQKKNIQKGEGKWGEKKTNI